MSIVFGVLVVLHLLGWAIVLGGTLVNMRSGLIAKGVLHGALTALLTGLILAVLAGATATADDPVIWPKLIVKLVVALVVCALVWWGGRREKAGTPLVGAVAGLTFVNVVIAVMWR
ncbi:hypothetical protein [Cellulomonas citrea]|uniref:hypothetical protein n=1 Tax=Cellulomonas citrea TaxID=1909423 RepID=UPI00135829FB|nr:hypothetical protein [Cellulomonas citrea]